MNQETKDTINIKEIVDHLKVNWKKVLICTAIAGAIGVVVSLLTPSQYSVTTTMLADSSSGNTSSGVSGLASLAGIKLGTQSADDGIPPTLYPSIVNSVPFRSRLMSTMVNTKKVPNKVSYIDYLDQYSDVNYISLIKKYTIGLPSTIRKSFTNDASDTIRMSNQNAEYLRFSKVQFEQIDAIGEQVSLTVDETNGIVTITANMPEPLMAAQMAKSAQELLKELITKYKTQKAQEELKYTQELFEEKEEMFYAKQNELSLYRDRNINLSSSLAQSELQRLETQYDLAFRVYDEIAKQLETAKLNVKEKTPSFTIIQPIVVPVQRSKPQRAKLVVMYTLIGMLLGLGILFIPYWYRSLME